MFRVVLRAFVVHGKAIFFLVHERIAPVWKFSDRVAEIVDERQQWRHRAKAAGDRSPDVSTGTQVPHVLARLAKQRIGLTDGQMAQLGPINQRFEGARRRIIRDERQTRLSLRQAMQDSGGGNQDEIARHMDRLIQLQRDRVDLLDREQRELAKVMTPAQRAKYMVFQENVRRRFEQAGQQNVVPDTTGQP